MTALAAAIDDTQTTIRVDTALPATDPSSGTLYRIGDELVQILGTSRGGTGAGPKTTWSVARGVRTTAASHAQGAAVTPYVDVYGTSAFSTEGGAVPTLAEVLAAGADTDGATIVSDTTVSGGVASTSTLAMSAGLDAANAKSTAQVTGDGTATAGAIAEVTGNGEANATSGATVIGDGTANAGDSATVQGNGNANVATSAQVTGDGDINVAPVTSVSGNGNIIADEVHTVTGDGDITAGIGGTVGGAGAVGVNLSANTNTGDASVGANALSTSGNALFQSGATTAGAGTATGYYTVTADAGTSGMVAVADAVSARLGFNGATPVARPELPASPTEQDIADVLVALGLVTQAA